jgi:hypothetical protein
MRYILLFILFINHSLFAQKPIDTTVIFNIGGIKQYVRIKGKDVSKPLILFFTWWTGRLIDAKDGQG